MLDKKYLLVIAIIITMMISPLNTPGILDNSSNKDIKTDAFTSGEIGGVSYSYGTNTYFASGNASRIDNGTLIESTNVTSTSVENIRLLMNVSDAPTEVWYRRNEISRSVTQNRTRENWLNQTGFDTWVNYVNNTVALKLALQDGNPGNLAIGQQLLALNVTEAYDVEDVVVVDQNGKYFGSFPANVTAFEYNDYSVLLGEPVHTSGIVVPKVMIFNVTYEVHEVTVKRTKVTSATMWYYNAFSRAYNISATVNQVNITNGENFGVSINMFDSISANYTESVVSYMGYYFFSYDITELNYTSNGQAVDWGNYPRNMLPKIYSTNGSLIEAGYNKVESKLISTYQSVVSAFATVKTDEGANNLSIQARLAIWGVSTSTTMVAFEDGNENGRLDLGLNKDGLEVGADDFVTHLGLAEAYETKVLSARYRSHNYTESIWAPAWNINETETVLDTPQFDIQYDEWGFGDINADTTATFEWTDPVMDNDGNVEFNFGVTYDNFPVTWIDQTDGTATTDFEDITYKYKVVVNPTTGRARISPTWIYGGVNGTSSPQLAEKLKGKSLALILTSEFFAVQATYTATQSNETINSTSSSGFGKIGVKVGGGDATEIDVTGPKQFYTLNGTNNETASFDVINLVTVMGSFSGERTSAFSSESEDTGGTASTSIVETLDVDFFYSANIIIVTYPNWGGEDIVHDPDFNVEYDKVDKVTSDPTTTDPTTDPTSNTTEVSSSTSEKVTTSVIPDTTPAETSQTVNSPGFIVISTLGSIVTLVVLLRSKKR